MHTIRLRAALAMLFTITLCAETHARDVWPIPNDDWPMYGHDLQHTFSKPDSPINPNNVSNLEHVWSFSTGDAVSASPSIVKGIVYVGAWDGFFYALDAHDGSLVWKFQVDCQNTVAPVPPQCLAPGQTPPDRFFTDGGLITSSAAVVSDRVYFAAGKTFYSLNARDGALLWKRVICGNPDDPNCVSDVKDPTQIFSSPAVFDGSVFIGWTAGAVGYRGGFMALDAETGEIRWRFEVDPLLDARGVPVLTDGRVAGGINRGCGTVWSSAAIDVDNNLVFFGTGDCNNDVAPPYHDAVIALETKTGQIRWAFRPPENGKHLCDVDFGASPNVIDSGGRQFVGIGGKDGTYYVLDRLTHNPSGSLVWSKNVVFGGSSGGFIGTAAFDGWAIFSATSIGDGNPFAQTGLCTSDPRDTFIQEPSMHALKENDGTILWEQIQNHSAAPTSLVNGVAFSGLIGIGLLTNPDPSTGADLPALNAYDTRTGALLWSYRMPGSVNSGATPVGDMVFVGSGNSTDGGGSAVHAFRLP